MAEHTLPTGKRLIRGLSGLGAAMRYNIRREFPVLSTARGSPMAVDVAWFGDETQVYPLMIFEVESRAGNTIANNPLKVFAQDTKQFEKPLFFFHVVLDGDSDTPRTELLERQYGTHNYRVYRIGRDEGTSLVRDVLRQHRRIRQDLDHVAVYELLAGGDWCGFVDPLAVLDEAHTLRFSEKNRVAALIHLARNHLPIKEQLPPLVEHGYTSGWDIGDLRTFIADPWAPALFMAWMIGSGTSPDADLWDGRLIKWQNETSYMPMFCSDLALSHDYAEFLLGLGGPFVALLVGLARGRGKFCGLFLDVLLETLDKLSPSWHGLQVALWALHVAGRLQSQHEFERARAFINAVGGVSASNLLKPPSVLSVTELSEDEQFGCDDKRECPPFAEFLTVVSQRRTATVSDRTDILLRVLDDDSAFVDWSDDVLRVLWDSRERQRHGSS